MNDNEKNEMVSQQAKQASSNSLISGATNSEAAGSKVEGLPHVWVVEFHEQYEGGGPDYLFASKESALKRARKLRSETDGDHGWTLEDDTDDMVRWRKELYVVVLTRMPVYP